MSSSALELYETSDAPCYDRSLEPQTAVVDAHLHFRPFGGPEIPFEELVSYLEETGVLFANVYGIGQTLPDSSSCTYYLDCPGTPLTPSLDNDLANAAEYVTNPPSRVHLTMSMTFQDLARPATILPAMQRREEECPGVFSWMGEVNLVKQAVFDNSPGPIPEEVLDGWAPFMEVLWERNMPLSIHGDLGNDEDPTLYLPLMEGVLGLYPDNNIVWMHMGLSREFTETDPARHVTIMKSMLDRHPNLMLDISWRVIDDTYFSDPDARAVYIPFLNEYSERILPGTDFLAVRSFPSDRFRSSYDEEIRQRATWYYCPQALSEYKMPFLDIAQRQQLLGRMSPCTELDGGYARHLFEGPQPTAVGFSEQHAFRHYLHALRGQVRTLDHTSYDEARAAQDGMLDDAENLLRTLSSAGVRGQQRDFTDSIDVNRAALALIDAMRGPILQRRWSALG